MRLRGKVAIVTGSAGGIGRSICERLAREGADVVGLDLATQEDTREIVEKYGVRWRGIQVDIADESAAVAAIDEIIRHIGDISILVNNAAVDDPVSFDDLDLDRWRRVLRIDLEAPFILVKAAVTSLRRAGGGSIINIASGSVVNAMPRFVAYRAAKMGLIGLTRALAMELGADGITVNAVSPGVTMTAMAQSSLTPDFLDQTRARQAIHRTGDPTDIANTVAFLAGPDARFITGQTVMVNGGAAFT